MRRFGGLDRISRPAVALASVSSCALVGVAALGAVTPPVVAGAVGAAAVTAALSVRAGRTHEPRRSLLPDIPVGTAPSAVTISAPRASDAAAAPSVDSAA